MLASDKIITINDDVAITFIVFVGLFFIVALVGVILIILFREWKKFDRGE